MSRRIDLTQPLSEADVRYLRARGRHGEVERNRKQHGKEAKQAKTEAKFDDTTPEVKEPEEQSEKLKLDQDIFERVKNLSVDDLRKELAREKIGVPTTERDMRIHLARHLQDKRDRVK